MTVVGRGSATETLGEDAVRGLLETAFADAEAHRRLLVIIPDLTRSAPIPLLFRILYDVLGERAARLDYLIALGTHQPLNEASIAKLVGVSAAERKSRYPKAAVFNHRWDDPNALETVGVISSGDMTELTGGLVTLETPVNLNRMIHDYDQLLILGPVFPHEVAGFSGGAKYLFPGIAGPEIIDSTHWLGALSTSYETIGVKDTAVRRVLHHGARFVTERTPVTCLKLVVKDGALHGLYIGDVVDAWEAAAELSAKLNIVYKPKPFSSVLSLPSEKYDDLWTAAKAMYKTEPVVADGGEVIIYAPHIKEISVTHGPLIEAVGYHVRDYFLGQWEAFQNVPWTVLAHSTHVKGAGSYSGGLERPRIQVTLATSIPEAVCRRIDLGYKDPGTLNPDDWRGREDDGRLLVENAGEVLYRLQGSV